MEREPRRLRRRPETAVPGPAPAAVHPVLALQRSAGNQAVRGHAAPPDPQRRESEKKTAKSETIGKWSFPDQSWHRDVKPLIMSTITVKGLQKLSPHDKPSKGDRKKTRQKDTKPTNCNFYIEKDGEITFGPNSTLTSRGRRTGYWLSKSEGERPRCDK